MRTLGIDIGEKRLGVAVSDSMGLIAVPHCVIQMTGDKTTDLKSVVNIAGELAAEMVVVGFPINLKGQISHSAEQARDYAELLRQNLKIPVVLQDERLTSSEAEKKLKQAGVSTKKARQKVDMMAAAIILQSWLDSKAHSPKRADVEQACRSQPNPTNRNL